MFNLTVFWQRALAAYALSPLLKHSPLIIDDYYIQVNCHSTCENVEAALRGAKADDWIEQFEIGSPETYHVEYKQHPKALHKMLQDDSRFRFKIESITGHCRDNLAFYYWFYFMRIYWYTVPIILPLYMLWFLGIWLVNLFLRLIPLIAIITIVFYLISLLSAR